MLEGVETIKQKGMGKEVLNTWNQMEQLQSTIYSFLNNNTGRSNKRIYVSRSHFNVDQAIDKLGRNYGLGEGEVEVAPGPVQN